MVRPATVGVNTVLRATCSRRNGCLNNAVHQRYLATPSSSKPNFTQKLDEGPSFDDFVSGDTKERIVLGNTSAYV